GLPQPRPNTAATLCPIWARFAVIWVAPDSSDWTFFQRLWATAGSTGPPSCLARMSVCSSSRLSSTTSALGRFGWAACTWARSSASRPSRSAATWLATDTCMDPELVTFPSIRPPVTTGALKLAEKLSPLLVGIAASSLSSMLCCSCHGLLLSWLGRWARRRHGHRTGSSDVAGYPAAGHHRCVEVAAEGVAEVVTDEEVADGCGGGPLVERGRGVAELAQDAADHQHEPALQDLQVPVYVRLLQVVLHILVSGHFAGCS